MVIESDVSHQLQLVGTESAADASLFYIIPIRDPTHPSEFHITYYTRRRHYTTHVDDLYRTFNEAGPPLPHYLSTDTDRLGKTKGSLSLKSYVDITQARFSLHTRIQSWFLCIMCTSTPTDLGDWLQGEQFYIKCSYHTLFKVNGYLAAVKEVSSDHERESYKITPVFSAAGKDLNETGMLFRLHPEVIRDNAIAARMSTVRAEENAAEQSPPEKSSTEESTSPQSPHAESAESSHIDIPPPIHAALSKQLFISAIVVGTAGMLIYVVYRSIS